jgi:hypothetical protein
VEGSPPVGLADIELGDGAPGPFVATSFDADGPFDVAEDAARDSGVLFGGVLFDGFEEPPQLIAPSASALDRRRP